MLKKIKSRIINVKFGKNVTIIEPVNLYNCSIGDNSFIGPFVEIQKNVFIGKNTRIQSHSFICEGVTISDECFIGHGVMFVNDLFKNNKIEKNSLFFLKTHVGKKTLIGSNSTILPVNIGSGVTIGAGSVVTKNLIKNNVYYGNPAKKIKSYLK